MKNPEFLKKVFTKAENEYFENKKFIPESVAVGFCAKEAFAKALGTGFKNFNFCDVEVLHSETGAPYINTYNDLKKLVQGKNIHLSLSHSNDYATAMVVIEE